MGLHCTCGRRAYLLRNALGVLTWAVVCLKPAILAAQAYAVASARTATRSAKASSHTRVHVEITNWEAAERSRDAFEATVESTRTRTEYSRVMNRFRAVYHDNPRDLHAPEAINAVAELLAESGRDLHNQRSFEAAIGQYEFLRTQYPTSSLRVGALLAEGQIAENDLHDSDQAREKYQLLLKVYPKSALAEQAKAGLVSLRMRQHAAAPLTADATSNDLRNVPVRAAADSGQVVQPTRQPAAPVVRSQAAQATGEMRPAAGSQGQAGGTSDLATELPPPRQVAHRAGALASVSGIRHWSTASYTRVAIDLGDEVEYEAARVPSPDRIFFDLHGARLAQELIGKSFSVTDDGFLKRIRVSQSAPDVARVVLDVNDVTEYSAFLLPNPYRLIIDIHGRSKSGGQQQLATIDSPAARTTSVPNTHAVRAGSPTDVNALSDQPGKVEATSMPTSQPVAADVSGRDRSAELLPATNARASSLPALGTTSRSGTDTPGGHEPGSQAAQGAASTGSRPEVTRRRGYDEPAAAKSSERALRASVDGRVVGDPNSLPTARSTAQVKRPGKKGSKATTLAGANPVGDPAAPARAALKTADGETSLVRALGLKINRIVIDAGHGGHDSGTLGVDGLQEKDVVLDVALRLGNLLHEKLGAEVIYTRSDDTFIPLETRTAIANKAQADLFLSIHANSSPDASARGVETYYLNFTQQADALEVAARENAVSGQSIHQLSDLVRKITLKDKIAESREFATDVESSLYAGLAHAPENMRGSSEGRIKDRGVKKAPFVVLIGANMPSILAEISFVTNARDAADLRQPEYKQRVAESLYRGVARYVGSLSGAGPAPVQTERASATGQ